MTSHSDSSINAQEHFYHDDPNVGHPDVRTELPEVAYFFLGNGLIQAAIQRAAGGAGTPLGILIMDPNRLRPKREALTMDADTGLEATLLRLSHDGTTSLPERAAIETAWAADGPVPSVVARWSCPGVRVEEAFSCPSWRRAALARRITLRNTRRRPVVVTIETGVKQALLRRRVRIPASGVVSLSIEYTLAPKSGRVTCAFARPCAPDPATLRFWSRLSTVTFGHPLLDHFFRTSVMQLPAAVSRRGVMDGSIWQYNREWLRDQAMVALALTMAGAHELATTMFNRFLESFVTVEGDTVDSSERRPPPEVELDQNGILLYTLKEHALWTGSLQLVRKHWSRIVAAAEFPLRTVFRHEPSGLLMNRREFWERHCVHGIEPGLELAHQLYAVHGLAAAAVLARLTGHDDMAVRWEAESARIRVAMLEDPQFRMWDARGFIKRRNPDGTLQESVVARPESGLPAASPLAGSGQHLLNPDTSAALPIALGIVAPDSPLCRSTLDTLETLWNQEWRGGGYGRYHASSEPDSPGAWPFASLFVARACVETGDNRRAWRVLKWLGRGPGAVPGTWSEFYGKRLAPPFPQVGFVPWNWAEMIMLLVHHVLGVRPEADGVQIRPRLLSGLAGAEGKFRLRGGRMAVRVVRTGRRDRPAIETNLRIVQSGDGEATAACRRLDASSGGSTP